MGKIKVSKTKSKYRKSKTTNSGNRKRCSGCGRYL